jgi:hypothetical protein
VTADGAVNVFIPMTELPGLSVPPLAITDGSVDPTWIELPCQGGYVYQRKRTLRLPFDAATADVARRRLHFDRRQRTVWTPISVALLLAGLATVFVPGDGGLFYVLPIVFFAASAGVSIWTSHLGKKVAVAQHPQLVGRLGVYLPAVSAAVSQEWVAHNAAVQVVPERPRWRRYPSQVYRWASGLCAVAGVGVWWVALRDGTFELTTLLVFVLLVGAAVVLAFKALPVGFIRWDDARGRR